MSAHSSLVPKRSMEERCTTLSNLTPNSENWFVKVLVTEKTPIRLLKWGTTQQKLVFLDKENKKMQCIIYHDAVEQLDKVLQLYHTYYIGGKIRELKGNAPRLTASTYEIVLNRSSYIKPTSNEHELSLNRVYDLTSFTQCPEFMDVTGVQINLLCGVIHVFPRYTTRTSQRNAQQFVIINEERRPMLLTLWEEFLQTEAPYLTDNVHKMPIILGMRLSVSSFGGVSVGTVPNSVILFDPPIPETQHLQSWLNANKDYAETVIVQRLYEEAKKIIEQPFQSQVRKISQITILTETVKSFWVKAEMKITKLQQRFYFLACPKCANPCGAAYDTEFTCFFCFNDFPSPKAMLRFEVELFDGTGSLNAIIEEREARTLLAISAEDIIQLEFEEKKFDLEVINKKFEDSQLLFHLRTSNLTRVKTAMRYTVLTYLPVPESSSTREVSGEKSLPSTIPGEKVPIVAMVEDEESTSMTQQEGLQPKSTGYPVSSATKRTLESTTIVPHKASKHAKED